MMADVIKEGKKVIKKEKKNITQAAAMDSIIKDT